MHGYALVERLSPTSLAVLALVAGPERVLRALRDTHYLHSGPVAWETTEQVDRLMRRKPEAPGR